MEFEIEVQSSDLCNNSVPLSVFMKVMGLDLKVTDYGTHVCSHCGIDYGGYGVTGSIIGFGSTPYLSLRAMVDNLNEHARIGDRLFPTYPADRTRRISIPFKVSFDWGNLKKYFPGPRRRRK